LTLKSRDKISTYKIFLIEIQKSDPAGWREPKFQICVA